MYSIRATKCGDGRIGILEQCPHCRAQQVPSPHGVCSICYEPMPKAANLISDVEVRVACHMSDPPWED